MAPDWEEVRGMKAANVGLKRERPGAANSASRPRAAHTSNIVEGAPSMARATILVVEDDDDTRDLIRCVLQCEGFAVLEAEDGRQALQVLEQSSPDLLLTDLMMPHLDGIELIRHLRARDDLAYLPIVVMTACGSYVRQALVEGVTGMIEKPADPDQLVEIIKQAMSQRCDFHPELKLPGKVELKSAPAESCFA
jgi:two-component system chemotaxis response regulator CheY